MQVSVLNLVPLRQGQTYQQAIADAVALAQTVEDLGYSRYWIAEHHNTPTVASSATQLLIQHVLSQTTSLRVGAGGVMLPNHSPYLVAEQYGTLEILYPGRVDLGLGRAPGTDLETARAIRKGGKLNPDFRDELDKLFSYFADSAPVHAYPAAGLTLPYYILGSSTDSAYVAAELGLPYVFAGHFAPAQAEEAIAIYRREFQPSDQCTQPYVILGANAILADTDAEAARLQTTMTQAFLGIVNGQSRGLMPPVESEVALWQAQVDAAQVPHFGPVAFTPEQLIGRQRQVVQEMTRMTLVGSPATVSQQLADWQLRLGFDELMVNSYIYDTAAQAHSYALLKQVVDSF